MRNTFKCLHCQRICPRNPRLKGNQQHYCSNTKCQNARKRKWEHEKCQRDASYKTKRAEARKKSYRKRRGDKYQSEYRRTHPEYCKENRKKQLLRNRKRQTSEQLSKIVKTDALNGISVSDTLISKGFYRLLPCQNTDTKKIVNTDMLIVQLYATKGTETDFVINSG